MASTFSAIWSSPNHLLNSPPLLVPSPSPFLVAVVSQVSSAASFSSFLAMNATHHHHIKLKLKQPIRASAQGDPSELIEDSKFVPLNPDDPVYGPPALLLLGFEVDEAVKIKEFLKELGGEFLEVIFCTEDMSTRSLWESMHTKQPDLEAVKVAKSIPRICFLSGLSGEEMIMFTDAFPETGLKPAVFAALVPNSADKPLQELIEEIMGDHEMLTGSHSSSTEPFAD